MPDPYAEFQQPAAVDPYAEFAAPAGADWLEAAKAKAAALDERLAGSVAPPAPTVDPGGIGALGHGLQAGLTAGWQPKIEAGVTAALGQAANAMGGNEGSFGDIYQRELAKNLAEGEKLKAAHPKTHFAGDVVGGIPMYSAGNPILAASLAGGARSAGESENVLGEKGTNLRGLAETAGGAAAGGATAYLLPKVFGALGRRYGRKADEAAEQTVTFGTQTARDKFNKALAPVRAMSPGGEMAPGEIATILKNAGAVGGVRGQRGTLEGIQEAKQALGDEFRGIINAADKAHPGVPVSSAQAHLGEAVADNEANSVIERETSKALGRVQKLAGDKGIIPHAQLQDVLENMNRSASKIYNKPPNNWTESEAAYIASYRALRNAQAEGLQAATGVDANDIRKYLATFYSLEPVAQKAVNRFEGNDKIGLLGELQKSRGATGIGHGALMLATGNPGIAAPMILKGALDVVRGHLGKATSPLRSNLATSINLGLQRPMNALSQSEAARLLGAKLGAEYGGQGAGALYDAVTPEPEAPEGPTPPPSSYVLAKSRGRKGP